MSITSVPPHQELAELRRQLDLAHSTLRQNEGLFYTVVEQAPMGVYVVDDQFRLQQVNARALPAFANVDARVGRDFAEVMNILWGPEVGKQLSDIFRHTLATGEAYISPRRFSEFRQDLGEDRSYEWETRRVTLPNGRYGVVCYFNDITETVRSETTLRQAKAAAETASRAKDQFLAALSHELRTPLTPVLLAAESLRDDPRLPEDVREHLNMIERNIALESRLLDDLFDITAVSQGKLQLRAERFDAHSLIDLAIEIVQDDAATKDIVLVRDFAADHSGLFADTARFQQVIWNLLRNAVKFTPAGGRISVHTSESSPAQGKMSLRIEVSDSGIGIASGSLQKIFRPFEQAEMTGDHRFGGMGLGLAIARAIVDLHQGKIWAESSGKNRGAKFIVEFPDSFLPPKGISKTAPQPIAAASARALKGGATSRRLLVVEDHAPTLQVISMLLQRAGYDVVTAGNIKDALEAATKGSFDFVVSDLGLPDGSGIQLMEKLKADYQLRGIALSGYGMEEDIKRASAAGFVGHLVKPVRIADLKNLLATFN